MENIMSSQTLQVNGVFKNSELINHQPNKKVYSKPYLFCEKFVPQEFVAGCDIPKKKYVNRAIPAIEADNVAGWSDGDNSSYNNNNYYLYFDDYETYGGAPYKRINQDTYPNDTHQGEYYEYKLTSPGILVHRAGNSNNYTRMATFPAGTIFYSTSIYEIADNNASKTVS